MGPCTSAHREAWPWIQKNNLLGYVTRVPVTYQTLTRTYEFAGIKYPLYTSSAVVRRIAAEHLLIASALECQDQTYLSDLERASERAP